MKLHKDIKAFRELILATAQNTPGLQVYQVEKLLLTNSPCDLDQVKIRLII